MPTATSSKLLLVLGLFLLTGTTAQAEVATPEEMARVCRNWLTYVTDRTDGWAREAKPEITDVEDLVASDGKTVLGRCFSIAPRGFVVVPVLKELPPVKAYSDRNGLDVTETEGMPQLIREVLEDRVRLFKAQYGGLDASQPQRGEVLLGRAHRQRWDQLLVSTDQFKSDLDRSTMAPLVEVGPLLTSDWHQGEPYWNTCPYGNGGQTYVGCVATAASQLMNYHQWPPNGVGNHSYYWQGDDCDGAPGPPYPGAGVLSADFSDAYDWANIPDDCSIGCTSAQEDALAELCYEVGVAYEMDYGACGSGAYTMQVAVILPRYFRYTPGIDVENRYDHTAATWFSAIQDEINTGRPMLYRISGHAIVCDGWRDTGGQNEYHMNYGWGGSQTVWYAIDDLYCPWDGCDPMVEQLARYIEPWQPTDPDCNDNTIPDYQEIWDNPSLDCNENAIPDECDIEDGGSDDCQPNGVPDECDIVNLVVPDTLPTCDATADNGDAWCDDIESYAVGTVSGNNWEGWGGDPGALGTVTTEQNHTPGGSKSLKIMQHDTVRLFHGYDQSESSAWILSAWVYIPSSMMGTAHFIINPDYVNGEAGTTWAINLEMNAAAGTINSNEALTSLPLITDAWGEIRLQINFAQDSVAIFYDDDFLVRHAWTNRGGSLNISAIDLWSPDSSGHYYDDFALYPTTGVDSNGDGVPDECECFASSPAEPELLDLELNPVSRKIRYLSFKAGDAGHSQAIRVTFHSLPSPYDHWNGTELWVHEPQVYCENAGVAQADPCPEGAGELPSTDFRGAQLGCDPHWTDWTAYDVVHVWNEGIIPRGTYDIQVIEGTCSLDVEGSYSDALTLTQSVWADLVQDCSTTPCKPPDGSTGIVDVTAILDKWKNLPGNVKKVRADIEGSPAGDHRIPDQTINITDVTYCLGAYLGQGYPAPGFPAPSDPPVCGP